MSGESDEASSLDASEEDSEDAWVDDDLDDDLISFAAGVDDKGGTAAAKVFFF